MIANPKTRLFVSIALSLTIVFFLKSFFGKTVIETLCNCELYEIAYIVKSTVERDKIMVKLMDGTEKIISKRRVTEKQVKSMFGNFYDCCVHETQYRGSTYFFSIAYINSIERKWEDKNLKYFIRFVDTRKDGKYKESKFPVSSTHRVERLYDKWKKNGQPLWEKVEKHLRNKLNKDLHKHVKNPENLALMLKDSLVLSPVKNLELERLIEIKQERDKN